MMPQRSRMAMIMLGVLLCACLLSACRKDKQNTATESPSPNAAAVARQTATADNPTPNAGAEAKQTVTADGIRTEQPPSEPAAGEPATTGPAGEQPVAAKATDTQPAATEPPATEAPSQKPAETKLAAPGSAVDKPAATEQHSPVVVTDPDRSFKIFPADDERIAEARMRKRARRAKPETAAARGTDLRSAELALLAEWDKFQSFTAKLTVRAVEGPTDPRLVKNGSGTYDIKKRKGLSFLKMDMMKEMTPHAEGTAPLDQHHLLTLIDGEALYMMDEKDGVGRAVKLPGNNKRVTLVGGRFLLQQLHETYDLELLPDEQFNGHDVVVIKAMTREPAWDIMYYFDKKTGIAIKMAAKSTDGKTRVMTLDDIKLDVPFSEDHFVFNPPEGVRVRDLTTARPAEISP